MRALIIGAQGQVGRAIAAAAPKNVEIIAFGRAECDLADLAAIDKAVARAAPDVVFNAAAYTAVDRAESDRDRAVLINAVAAGMVAEAARSAGARTIHISTDFVFSGTLSRPYRPDDATDPLNVYGQSKRDGERAVLSADVNGLIVRTAWVYAARGTNFVNTMLRLLRQRDRIEVVADQIGTPTHAASLARALWKLAANKAKGIYHYSDAGVASWYDFAVAIEEEARAAGLIDAAVELVPVTTLDHPGRAQRPAYSVMDKTATWRLIEETPPHWRVNLQNVLKELKEIG